MKQERRAGRSGQFLECVIDCRCNLGEAPVWSPRDRSLYWLDIAAKSRLFEWSASSGRTRQWSLEELATGLASSRDGGLVVVSESGLNVFRKASGDLQCLAPAPFSKHRIRFNDCGCDRAGRLWTGTMRNNFASEQIVSGSEPDGGAPGTICRFDSDLSCALMASGIGCPNTFAWSLNDKTFYTADSAAGCLYAYDFDLETGAIANRRTFAAPGNLGVPDGSAVDVEGCLWNARWGAGSVVRFAPDGQVTEVVSIPADLVTSCAFGGPNLDTLYITTARRGLSERDLMRQPHAGGVFAFKPGIPGTAPPSFLGAVLSA